MSRRRRQRGQEVTEGLLAGHVRTGRTYRPPLRAYPASVLNDWVASDLPDLLWPLVLVGTRRARGAFVMARAQASVISVLPERGDEDLDGFLDGRLTSLEAVDAERDLVATTLYEHDLSEELFSPEVMAVADLYGSDLPGAWLFAAAPRHGEPIVSSDAWPMLGDAIVRVVDDRHLNALVKSAPYGWLLQSGRLHLPQELADELVDYPNVIENREKVDASILSGFLATKHLELANDAEAARAAWAKQFWNLNWSRVQCIPEEHVRAAAAADEEAGTQDADDADLAEVVAGSLADATELYQDFLRRALDPEAPVDLMGPAGFEVLTGLVARAWRSVVALLRSPHGWSGEQAAPAMRGLIEARVVAEWMITRDDGEDWFATYQDYGRGKRKLHREIVDDLLKRAGDVPPPPLVRLRDQLVERTSGEHGEAFQDVSVEATFSGRSMRQMAEDAGLTDLYRFSFQTESGVTHGEWWAIEEQAMQRCLNPLHRWHLLPTFAPGHATTREFPPVLLDRFEDLIDVALVGILGPDADPPDDATAGSS